MIMFERLEKMRKRTLLLSTFVWILAIAAAAGFFVYALTHDPSSFRSLRLFSLVCLLIGAVITKYLRDAYQENFRNAFYQEIFGDNTYQLSFDEAGVFGAAELKSWGVLPNVIHAFTKNTIQGSKDGLNFTVCELDVQGKERIEGPSAWFHGLYVICDLNQKTKGTIQIRTPENLHMEQHENLFSIWNMDLKQVKTDVEWFDEAMNVYSDDQRLVKEVLSEEMMKKLFSLHQKFRRQIWMGIVDGQMHVAINQPKSFFQPGLFSKVNENTLGKQRKNIEELTILINEITGNH
jgi:hypothetical protein